MTDVAIRAFVAIELSNDIQQKLSDVIASLQQNSGKAVRWVTPHNIHLTLKFLGNVSPANLANLTRVISNEVVRHKAFSFTVGGLGAYPNQIRPRIVWAGVDAPAVLSEIQHGIDRETNRLGYPGEERGFSPHLTLGRISQHAGPKEVKQISDTLQSAHVSILGTITVTSIRLFRSDLQPGGAVYTPLLSAPLNQ